MLEAFNSVFGDPNWVPVVRIIQDHFEKNIIIPPVELFANCEKTSYKTFSPEDDFDLFIVHKDIAFWFPVEWYMSLAQDCDVIYANPVFIVYAKKNLNIAQQEFEPAHYQNFLNLVENIRQRPKPSKQLIFLHIPKCAGTSLANSLKSEYPHFLHLDDAGLRNIEHTFDDVDFFFGHMTRATATKRKGNLEDVVWVIVLRDPLERFLSAIKHERRKDTYTSAKWVQVAREKKIQDALEEPSALRALHASLMYLGSQTNNFLTFQQDPEKLLEDIRSFLQQDNVVFGFQEDMESLYTILADMELMTKKEVPRLNVTQNHESVESAETQEAWESLQNHLAPDYKLYADAKKIFEQRFGSILAKKRQKIF